MPVFYSVDHITEILNNLPECSHSTIDKARERQLQLTKPPGSLGKLEDIAIWLAGWQHLVKPQINNGQCLIFAGNHGVVAKGVSSFPAEVTTQMVLNFEAGGAAINQLCREARLALTVTPLQLDVPTGDISEGMAMTSDEVISAMNAGAKALNGNCDYLVVGEMGIGNTTAAAALSMALFGGIAHQWVGPGTGLNDAGVARKARIVEEAFARHGCQNNNPVSLLAHYGGRELAAIAGAVLAARLSSTPVMLDGFISSAAASALTAGNRLSVLDHCKISHISVEPGHLRLAAALRKQPIIDLGMRLGEGSGAATATLLVRAALATHNGMATFAEAGVSKG